MAHLYVCFASDTYTLLFNYHNVLYFFTRELTGLVLKKCPEVFMVFLVLAH